MMLLAAYPKLSVVDQKRVVKSGAYGKAHVARVTRMSPYIQPVLALLRPMYDVYMERVKGKANAKKNEDKVRANALKEEGNAHFRGGDYERAVACYKRALCIVHRDAPLCSNLALCYLRLGESLTALGMAEDAVREAPLVGKYWGGLATVSAHANRPRARWSATSRGRRSAGALAQQGRI